MKKLLTVLACAAAVALCVLLGLQLGRTAAGAAGGSEAASAVASTASSAAAADGAFGSAQSAASGVQVIGFAITPPQGFENTTEPDMNAAYLHADSSEILLKTYDIANFEGGMGVMTQDMLLQILTAAYQAEYGLDPDYTVNSYAQRDIGACPGYLLDVTVQTHRGDETYRQLLYAADTDTGTMYLWSFTDESGTQAHMEEFSDCIAGIEQVTG